MCPKIWVSVEFKAKTSPITSLLASFPHCGLVKIKMTFIPIVSPFVAVICPGVLACLLAFCCLVLCMAGGSLSSVLAGHVGDVLTDGAVCAVQPAGSEKQWRGLRRLWGQVRNKLGQEPLVIWKRKGAGHHLGRPPFHRLRPRGPSAAPAPMTIPAQD